jgi:ABC-type transport system involved in multi-copper enzyme maturation permease subunit
MNTARFVHQQIFQLKWHVLASIGLIMAVPLEEAVVNLHAGDGFHSSSLTMVTLLLGPLLAGLIACANVQADLDEKRDAFWRSKPVRVWQFIAGKFVIGLILALVIVACPILFMWTTTSLAGGESLRDVRFIFLVIPLISVLTYSVCFFCNVLVRKTARAWLIGMAIACFALLIPFILPLNIVDLATDLVMEKWVLGSILATTLGLAALSFMGSITAVQRNWQVHTQLRSLLWGGAGLIFVVFLLFSRQIANIKILDEKKLPEDTAIKFERQGGTLAISSRYTVTTRDNAINLKPISALSQAAYRKLRSEIQPLEIDKGLQVRQYPYVWQYPYESDVYCQIGTDHYAFRLFVYHQTEEVTTEEGKLRNVRHYKNAYLWCWRHVEGGRVPVSRIDLSEYLNRDASFGGFAARSTEDKVVVLLNGCCLVVDISKPESLVVIEDKLLKRSFYRGGVNVGILPLLPAESLDMEDRIRLGLSLSSRYQYRGGDIIINEQSDPISYALVSYGGIACYEVDKWDDETVTFKRRNERPFTLLETLFGSPYGHGMHPQFIQDGKLYLSSGNKLMVFDVAGPRIRKLGHFQRASYRYGIEDIKVVENGNILLLSRYDEGQGEDSKRTQILQLLKNPE